MGDAEDIIYDKEIENEFEVFKKGEDVVDFRTVSWQKASIIFLKVIFATGVLSIPTAMFSLGAVGGGFSVIGWGLLNTYTAIVQGNFRNRHAGCHSIADMANVLGGKVLREVVGLLFIVAYVLCTGSGILGVSIALNVFSTHGACTVWFTFVATVIVVLAASVRKFHQIGWLTYAGFFSIYAAVFIVVIAVTTRTRPATAPPTGDYDLGWFAVPPSTTFVDGMTATATIFVSSAGTSAFLPVISEMRNPKEYNKAVYWCMALVQASYLTFALVVYRWCGQYVANPSIGSAGHTVKIVSYAIGLVGLIVSACLYLHVASKYVFVRILRDSRHLQHNTVIHWATWLGTVIGLAAVAFIICEAVPIFSFLIALTGSVCFAPMAICLPAWLWLYDHWDYWKGNVLFKAYWLMHWGMIALGLFILGGGTYGVVQQIIDAYASGLIGGAFDCADNSGSVGT
ncbi:hypothetical protein NA57DRAFT_63457 [Rhizodiscina lignyota]|uniref:Amino acid transporter transmembrane domain-containing protein n=1 Tax=Rhizodiscina lignyota TaxID=1504668 RepID=A0A9P4M9V7_9PEZI|nr:hypothetical protein NA57DRAFT_63457 [Rhizodiscina lignyota]